MKTARLNRLKNKNYIISEEKTKNNINPKIIYDIYKNEFIDECDSILILKQKDFLEKYYNKIHLIIKSEYGENIFQNNPIINEIIKKCENDFINEIYSPMYNSCLFGLKNYNVKKFHNVAKDFLTNFLPHCSFDQVPLHTCGSKFIFINNINKNKKMNNNTSYVLCIGCQKCYYESCIKMYCPICQVKFYSYIVEKNKNNIYPATWKNYHCDDYMNNEQMTCIKCEDKLWVKDNILICKNCKLEVKPEAIIWTCIICKEEFKSSVKIYNELEFKEINNEIKNALLYTKIAKPNELPCKCLPINQIDNLEFNHNSNEGCKGILYYGAVDNKEFVVCSLCKKMTYLTKFYWCCPICNKKFISKRVKCYQKNSNNNIPNKTSDNTTNINSNIYSNKKFKKSQQNFYNNINNNNNNNHREIRKNGSYARKFIEIYNPNSNNEQNSNIDEPTEKRRNNSLIITNKNNNIFNFDNTSNKNSNNNNCDNNGSKIYYPLIQENKNNTSSSTVYSSVSYYNSSREREKETHKKIIENNPSYKCNNIYNKINDKKDIFFINTNINMNNNSNINTNINTCTNGHKNNFSISNKNDNIFISNKSYNNYIYEYNNNNKRETISAFNLKKGIKENKSNYIISNKLSYNRNIQGMHNKVYIPKKNFNNLSISINDENN